MRGVGAEHAGRPAAVGTLEGPDEPGGGQVIGHPPHGGRRVADGFGDHRDAGPFRRVRIEAQDKAEYVGLGAHTHALAEL